MECFLKTMVVDFKFDSVNKSFYNNTFFFLSSSDAKKKLRLALCSADSVVFPILHTITRNGLPDHADPEGTYNTQFVKSYSIPKRSLALCYLNIHIYKSVLTSYCVFVLSFICIYSSN